MLGPDDMMLRRGYKITDGRSKETLGADMEAVIKACKNHGKFGLNVGVSDAMLELSIAMEFQMIVGGFDVAFLKGNSVERAERARQIITNC